MTVAIPNDALRDLDLHRRVSIAMTSVLVIAGGFQKIGKREPPFCAVSFLFFAYPYDIASRWRKTTTLPLYILLLASLCPSQY